MEFEFRANIVRMRIRPFYVRIDIRGFTGLETPNELYCRFHFRLKIEFCV